MQGRFAEVTCIFQIPFHFLPGTNVSVIFYACNPQVNIKINLKFFQYHYHWIPVGYCCSFQAIYPHCNPKCESSSADPNKESYTGSKSSGNPLCSGHLQIIPRYKVTLFTHPGQSWFLRRTYPTMA